MEVAELSCKHGNQARNTTMENAGNAKECLRPEALDFGEALHRCFDNRDVLRQMILCFFDDFDTLVVHSPALLERAELEPLGQLGHRIKGSLVFLAADEAAEAAARVEQLRRAGACDPAAAAEAVQKLLQQCRCLESPLRACLAASDSHACP
jgi:hypothetical protein